MINYEAMLTKGPIKHWKEGMFVMMMGQEPPMDFIKLIVDIIEGAYKNCAYEQCVIINTPEFESSKFVVSFESLSLMISLLLS